MTFQSPRAKGPGSSSRFGNGFCQDVLSSHGVDQIQLSTSACVGGRRTLLVGRGLPAFIFQFTYYITRVYDLLRILRYHHNVHQLNRISAPGPQARHFIGVIALSSLMSMNLPPHPLTQRAHSADAIAMLASMSSASQHDHGKI